MVRDSCRSEARDIIFVFCVHLDVVHQYLVSSDVGFAGSRWRTAKCSKEPRDAQLRRMGEEAARQRNIGRTRRLSLSDVLNFCQVDLDGLVTTKKDEPSPQDE